jgi:uncharacterized membrane protein
MNDSNDQVTESSEQASKSQSIQSENQKLSRNTFALRVIIILGAILVMWLPLALGLGSQSGIEWLFFGPLIFLSTFGLLLYLLISALEYVRKAYNSQSSLPDQKRSKVMFGLIVFGIVSVVFIVFAKPVYEVFKVEKLSREDTLQMIEECKLYSITRQKADSVFIVSTFIKGSSQPVDPAYFEEYKAAIATVSDKCQIYINDDTRFNGVIELN